MHAGIEMRLWLEIKGMWLTQNCGCHPENDGHSQVVYFSHDRDPFKLHSSMTSKSLLLTFPILCICNERGVGNLFTILKN